MKQRRSLLAAAVALVAVAASVPAFGDEDPIWDWPWVELRSRVIRDISSSGNLWYAITLEVPKGKRYTWSFKGSNPAGKRLSVCGKLVAEPGDFYAGGSGIEYRTPRGNEPEAYLLAENNNVVVIDYQTQQAEDMPESLEMRCAWDSTVLSEEQVERRSFVLLMAANVPITDTRLLFTADPGVKILAESWGTNASKAFGEGDFAGGTRVASGVRGWKRDIAPAGVFAESNVSNDREVTLDFQRSSSALFFADRPWIYAPMSGVPGNYQALTSIKSPGRPPGTFNGGIFGEPDRSYALGTVAYAGESAGQYNYQVEALVGTMVDVAAVELVKVGFPPGMILATVDADMPACSTANVQWQESDGHPVCGPGPWRMIQGLPL